MSNKKIVIGNHEEKNNKDDSKPILKEEAAVNPDMASAPGVVSKQPAEEPLDENVWGTDYRIRDHLDAKQLADRRLYTRVIYMYKVQCLAIYDSLGFESTSFRKPMEFMLIDISMGGFGAISEYEIDVGTIVVFNHILDTIAYEAKCEVVYCFPNDGRYRIGLRIMYRDKNWIKHLKIYIARISLHSKYGSGTDK